MSLENVDLAVEPDRHVWTLEDWRITTVAFDTGGVRLTAWTMNGSVEIRITGRFRWEPAGETDDAGAAGTTLDAADTPSLAPLLHLLDAPLTRIAAHADGALEVALGDRRITVRPDARFEAWEAHGAGVLDGLGYLCPPGGGPPWGQAG